jgi:hypothetical protein
MFIYGACERGLANPIGRVLCAFAMYHSASARSVRLAIRRLCLGAHWDG